MRNRKNIHPKNPKGLESKEKRNGPVPSFLPGIYWKSEMEKKKLFRGIFGSIISFFFMVCCALFCSYLIMLVDQDLPPLEKYGYQLPDILFDLIDYDHSFVSLSERMIEVITFGLIFTIIFHKYRFVIIRRFCLTLGVLFILRGICLYVTRLPVPNDVTLACYQMHEQGKTDDIKRNILGALKITFFAGKQDIGMLTCGDLIFSGHITLAVVGLLTIWVYVRFPGYTVMRFIQGILSIALFLSTIFGLIISRTHYTVDIMLAIFISYFGFIYYHYQVVKLRSYNKQQQNKKGKKEEEVEERTIVDVPLIPFFGLLEKGEIVKSEFEWPWKALKVQLKRE